MSAGSSVGQQHGEQACNITGSLTAVGELYGDDGRIDCDITASFNGYHLPAHEGALVADMSGYYSCLEGSTRVTFDMVEGHWGGELDWGAGYIWFMLDGVDGELDADWAIY